MALKGYYTTTEAAGLLGLRAPTVRDAVRRGRGAGGGGGGPEPGDGSGDRAVPGGGLGDARMGGAQGGRRRGPHGVSDGRGGAGAAASVPGAQAGTGERVRPVPVARGTR